jgi:hypothetical protein
MQHGRCHMASDGVQQKVMSDDQHDKRSNREWRGDPA